MSPNKACPVILSSIPGRHILLFRHPIAGVQLVKGTIEIGETPAQTALRELSEESGIEAASVVNGLLGRRASRPNMVISTVLHAGTFAGAMDSSHAR